MNSPKVPATHIGRIGGLAIALGVGAAVATGTGVAWADPADTGTDSSAQASAGAAAPSRTSGPARRGGRGPAPAHSRPQTSSDTGLRDTPRAAATEPTTATTRSTAKNNSPEPAAAVPVTAPDPKPLAPQAVSRAALPSAPEAAVTGPGAAPAASEPIAVPVPNPAPAATVVVPAVVVPVAVAPAAVVADTPVATAAPQASITAPRLASRLLSAVGLAPLAGGSVPGAPLDSPALWALLGWTRRDAGRTGVRTAAAQAAQPASTVAAAAVTTPSTLTSTPVGWVTGQRNTAFPGLTWTQTNNTKWANIFGTDLGIMWFNPINGKTQLAFGDTFSQPNMTGDWRSNVLLLSDDKNLSDGLSLINTGPAYQFIPAARNQVFIIGSETTNIPTSGVYANNNNYVNYMSVKSWDSPGRWTTNYSAISQYDPATDKWVLQTNTIRPAAFFRTWAAYQAGDQNFQQMAYVLQPEDKVAPGETRYVYAFGTPAGRAGSAYLSRVPADSVTVMRKYEYWNGTRWVNSAARATEVIGDSTSSPGIFGWAIDLANNPNFLGGIMAGFVGAKTGGNVSEMSIQYNEYLDKYVVLYGNGANNVILRTADTPEGPWSDPVTIATSVQYPGLYAPMIHPLSGTGQLTDGNGNPDDSNLYWNMSIWSNYNVVLMKTDLSALKTTAV